MTDQEMLDFIASYDYGVYTAHGKIIIADPIGSEDGYYLVVDSIKEAYDELLDSGVLDGDRPDSEEVS